ncbi:BRO1 domain-containing protein [Aphelenchoides fujianensis]|nr:BRO1 domain-containing protein [Aphelenchoides fujianensis]
MFNIGCLHAMIAASQPRTDENSTKLAFKHFQCAAWPFVYLRDHLNAQRYGPIDFDRRSLTFYADVMLAQAHECLLEKSLADGRSPAAIAKLALRVRQFYDSCAALISDESFADAMPSDRFKMWTRLCGIKAGIFGTIFFFARGQHFEKDKTEEKNFGKALACYKAGLDLATDTMNFVEKNKRDELIRVGLKPVVQFVKEVITQHEQKLRKDNDFIYHERVPPIGELEQVEACQMFNAAPFDPMDPSVAGEDPFKELQPASVIEIVSLYEEAKAGLRRKVLADCEKKDEELNSFLMRFHFDKLNLDQPSDTQRLPEELIACHNEFSNQPNCLSDLLNNFYELITKQTTADQKLAELGRRMSGVTNAKITEDEGYKMFASKLVEYSRAHQTGRQNNTELQKAYEQHTENLKKFAFSLPKLANLICGDAPLPNDQSAEGAELRRLLEKVDEMRKQRLRLIADLRESLDRDEITSHALSNPHVEPAPLIRAQLARHDKEVELIQRNLGAQENVLAALTAANANFADRRKEIFDVLERKNTKSLELVRSFHTFKEIREKAKEAQVFYTRLLRKLAQLEAGISCMIDATSRMR